MEGSGESEQSMEEGQGSRPRQGRQVWSDGKHSGKSTLCTPLWTRSIGTSIHGPESLFLW